MVANAMAGANLPRVSQNALLDISIPIPLLAEQKRIVNLLDEADELRKLRTQANRRTAGLIPALFNEMFGDAIQNRKTWPVRRLEDVVASGKIVTYGIVQAGPNIPNGIPYIRTGDLKEGVIKVDGLLRTTPEIGASYRRSEVAAGDIVMSIRATVGTTAVIPQELDGANLTQGTARISPGKDTVTDYLLWFLRMSETQSWISGASDKVLRFRKSHSEVFANFRCLFHHLPCKRSLRCEWPKSAKWKRPNLSAGNGSTISFSPCCTGLSVGSYKLSVETTSGEPAIGCRLKPGRKNSTPPHPELITQGGFFQTISCVVTRSCWNRLENVVFDHLLKSCFHLIFRSKFLWQFCL